jgi:hypothetical protein
MPGQYIAAIIQPSVRTFAHEKSKASWGGMLAQLVIVTGIVGTLNYVRVLVQAATMDAETAARVAARAATGMPTLQEALSLPGPSAFITRARHNTPVLSDQDRLFARIVHLGLHHSGDGERLGKLTTA